MPQVHTKHKTAQECPLHPDKAWKWIPGFEDRFMASTCGDIRMHQSFNGSGLYTLKAPRMLNQVVLKNGYLVVHIQTDYKRKLYYAHRLVLLTFIGEPPTKHECAHLDGNSQHNHLSNLCWTTRQVNMSHTHKHGTCQCGERHYNAKLSRLEVQAILQAVDLGIPRRRLGEQHDVCTGTIDLIVQRRLWRFNHH